MINKIGIILWTINWKDKLEEIKKRWISSGIMNSICSKHFKHIIKGKVLK